MPSSENRARRAVDAAFDSSRVQTVSKEGQDAAFPQVSNPLRQMS
jgi:hypothetical protein